MTDPPPAAPAAPADAGPEPPHGAAGPRSGACALVGRPNVGKSTLLNALLGQKLAIATERPGTTRSRLLGLFVAEDPPTQIAFVDTPGLVRPRSALGRALADEAQAAVRDADVVLLVVELPRGAGGDGAPVVPEEDRALAHAVAEAGRPSVLAINKVDQLRDKRRLLPWLAAYAGVHDFAALVPISALEADGLDRLVAELRPHLEPGLAYDPETLTDRPERFFAAELVREAVLRHVRSEVPYGVAVSLEHWDDDGDLARLHATIVVEKASHKGIVIGARGERLRTIGTEARLAIEALVGRRVHLELWVRVEEGWTRSPDGVRRHLEAGGAS